MLFWNKSSWVIPCLVSQFYSLPRSDKDSEELGSGLDLNLFNCVGHLFLYLSDLHFPYSDKNASHLQRNSPAPLHAFICSHCLQPG
jgi:hypothetical protein